MVNLSSGSRGPGAYAEQQERLLSYLADSAQQQRIERAREMERIRGIKDMTWRVPFFTAAATLTIRTPVQQGWAWNLKMITGRLSASDSVAVYIGEANTGTLVGYVAAPGAAPGQNVFVVTWSSDQKILHSGESLFLQTSGAGNLTGPVDIMAVQVPAEEIGKVLG